MKSSTPSSSILLAAYAAGGLSVQERRRVDAYLAEHADARAELAQLRALVDATRDARPMPTSEPAWDDMARSIRLAVDEVKPSRWARTFSWLRARPLLVSGATAAALGVTLYLALGARPSDRPIVPSATVAGDRGASEPEPDFDLELPGLDEAWDADSIVYELDPEEEFEGMFATVEADDDIDPAIDFRMAPEFDTLLDTLTEEEIEAVEAYLEGTPS